jgi:hypothetical protein
MKIEINIQGYVNKSRLSKILDSVCSNVLSEIAECSHRSASSHSKQKPDCNISVRRLYDIESELKRMILEFDFPEIPHAHRRSEKGVVCDSTYNELSSRGKRGYSERAHKQTPEFFVVDPDSQKFWEGL